MLIRVRTSASSFWCFLIGKLGNYFNFFNSKNFSKRQENGYCFNTFSNRCIYKFNLLIITKPIGLRILHYSFASTLTFKWLRNPSLSLKTCSDIDAINLICNVAIIRGICLNRMDPKRYQDSVKPWSLKIAIDYSTTKSNIVVIS